MSLLSSAVRICDSSRGPATARGETRRAADAPSPASGISSSLWLINRRAQWASLPLRGEGGFVHFPGVRIRVRVSPSMRRASAAVSVSWAGREPQAQSGQCPRGAAIGPRPSAALPPGQACDLWGISGHFRNQDPCVCHQDEFKAPGAQPVATRT